MHDAISQPDRSKQIRQRRIDSGLSVDDVAQHLGIPRSQYVYLEKRCNKGLWTAFGSRIDVLLQATTAQFEKGLTTEAAERIGMRACARRKALLLSRYETAKQIGISPTTLSTWERRFPSPLSIVRGQRWAKALQVPVEWLFDETVPLPRTEPVRAPASGPSAMTVFDEIRGVVAWLAHRKPLERSTDWMRLNESELRNAQILLERYTASRTERTLAAIGARNGLTTERVRQICAEMLGRIDESVFDLPIALSVLEQLRTMPSYVSMEWREIKDPMGDVQSLVGFYAFMREFGLDRRHETKKPVCSRRPRSR